MHLLKDIWFPTEYLEQQDCGGPNQKPIITVSDKHLKLMSLSQLRNISFLPSYSGYINAAPLVDYIMGHVIFCLGGR